MEFVLLLFLIIQYESSNKISGIREKSELEYYIKTNKSLLDIPSADEITINGVELGDMQARMMKKIEELTLYIIELKKENEEIKNI